MSIANHRNSARHTRLSVCASSESICSAVVLPLVDVEHSPVCWTRAKVAPMLVPALSLGRRVVATEGGGAQAGTFSLTPALTPGGGRLLCTVCLEPELFEAVAMQVGSKDLMAMRVVDLKEELAARDELVSGNKAWLRRRLHAAIVRDHTAADGGEDDF